MPFPGFDQVPTSIGAIRIRLLDEDGVPANMRAYYDVDVLDQNEDRIQFDGSSGSLVPHLTQAQIDALKNFLQAIRAKAVAEFLA